MGCKRFFLKERKNVMFLNKIDLPYCLVVFFVVCPRPRPFWSLLGEIVLFWCSTAQRESFFTRITWRILSMHDRKLNGSWQRLLFARQLIPRKCSENVASARRVLRLQFKTIGVRAGGARGAAASPKFWATQIFLGSERKFGRSQFLKTSPCLFNYFKDLNINLKSA